MDAQHTFIGRSGDQDPLITIPMKEMSSFYTDGAIQDWKIAKALWRTCLAQMDVSPKHRRGLVLTIPTSSSRDDVRNMVEAMFAELPISSLLLTNVWAPVLIAHDLVSGVVVHVGHTDTVIVSIVRFSVSDACIVRLPFGARDVLRRIAAVVEVYSFVVTLLFQSLQGDTTCCGDAIKANQVYSLQQHCC
jgi:actin-related protein